MVLAIMMFFSLRYLGFKQGAIIFSLVPLVLGILNVFTAFAYGLTGFIFILACGTALVPDWRTKVDSIINLVIQDAQYNSKSEEVIAPDPRVKNNEKSKK